MADFEVRGTEQLARLGRALRGADKDLQREISKGLAEAVKPLQRLTRAASSRLPHRGGLAAKVARSRLSSRVRGGATASVTLKPTGTQFKDPRTLTSIDQGRVYRPTYGHKPLVAQRVRPGWFSEPVKGAEPSVRRELLRRIDAVLRRIA